MPNNQLSFLKNMVNKSTKVPATHDTRTGQSAYKPERCHVTI